jgi:hypothetical protein
MKPIETAMMTPCQGPNFKYNLAIHFTLLHSLVTINKKYEIGLKFVSFLKYKHIFIFPATN